MDIYIYIISYHNNFPIYLKLIQHCKSTIWQLKINKQKEKKNAARMMTLNTFPHLKLPG